MAGRQLAQIQTSRGLTVGSAERMTRPSRILVVENQSYGGGMWHYACCLSRALGAAGFRVILAATEHYEVLDGFGDLNISVVAPDIPQTQLRIARPLWKLVNQVTKFRRLRRLIHQFRPDIVHMNSRFGMLDFLYFRYFRALGARVAVTSHEPEPDSGVHWYDRARFRAADVIFVHSHRSMAAVMSAGVDGRKITLIHHGAYLDICPVSEVSVEEAKRSLGLPSNGRTILFFGAIQPYKGVDILLRAFSQLMEQDDDVHLVIAGNPEEDFAKYHRLIESLGITDRVRLDLRYIPFPELPNYFLIGDVVVFPYRWVQQSGALQLAYAYARPVVATDVGGLYDEVKEDGTGIIVPAEDPDSLAAALRQVLSDPRTAEEMGRRGRLLAETKYSWAAVVRKISETYGSLYDSTSSADA